MISDGTIPFRCEYHPKAGIKQCPEDGSMRACIPRWECRKCHAVIASGIASMVWDSFYGNKHKDCTSYEDYCKQALLEEVKTK